MSTAGAALRTMDLSTNMEITIMSRLADTIRTTFEQHLNESVHRFVQFSGYFSNASLLREAPKSSCQDWLLSSLSQRLCQSTVFVPLPFVRTRWTILPIVAHVNPECMYLFIRNNCSTFMVALLLQRRRNRCLLS